MKKTQSSKLTLSRESIRLLDETSKLQQVAGGAAPTTSFTVNFTCVTCVTC